MMMAHDPGSSGSSELPERVLVELRTVLAAYIAKPDDGVAVDGALRALALAAHEERLAPEQLLVALKDAWYDVAAGHPAREPGEHTRLLQRLVTLSIKAYYD